MTSNNQPNQPTTQLTQPCATKLNRYCMMIVSKYFNTITDFIKMEKCCKEYRGIIEQFHFNPISLKNTKNLDLFKNIDTYQFYNNPINGELKDFGFLRMLINDKKYNYIKKIAIPGIIDEDIARNALQKRGISSEKIVFTKLSTKYKKDGMNPNIAILNEVDSELKKEENRALLNNIVIPTNITELAPNCFEDYFDVDLDDNWKREKHWPFTKIDIPSSVSEIGASCFYNCKALNQINIPYTIERINDKLFYNCSSLNTIKLPPNIYSIGKESFYHCTSIKEINLPSNLTKIGDSCFCGCSSLSKINIPSSISQIGSACFCGCESLTTINLPNSITSLGDNAFSGSGIHEITLPDSIQILPTSCFASCFNLKTVKLPSNIKSIGKCCFILCNNLLNISSSLNKLEINQIIIPSTVSYLGNNSFFRCSSIQNVILNNSLKEIPDCAFGNCINLNSINIPNSITSIGSLAFSCCSNLRNITIPSSVIKMAPNTFYDTKKLQVFFRYGSQIYNQFRSTGTYKYPSQRVKSGKFTPLFYLVSISYLICIEFQDQSFNMENFNMKIKKR